MIKFLRNTIQVLLIFAILFSGFFTIKVYALDQCTECGCDDNACKYEGKDYKSCECFGPQPCVEMGYTVSCGGGSSGGGGGGPEYKTIAGFVNDMTTSSPIENVEVLITRQDQETKTVTTNSSGYFEQKDFVEKDQLYDVEVISSDYKWAASKAITNMPSWSWDNCANPSADTANGSAKYLCQKAGSGNDCAGPNGDGNKKRCNFLLPEYLQTTVDLVEDKSSMCFPTDANGQIWLGDQDQSLGDYNLQAFSSLTGTILDTEDIYSPNKVSSNQFLSSPFNFNIGLENLDPRFTRQNTSQVCVGTGINFPNHDFENNDANWTGNDVNISSIVGMQGSSAIELSVHNDGDNPYDPYFVSDFFDTGGTIKGNTFTLSFYAKLPASSSEAEKNISGIGLQVPTTFEASSNVITAYKDQWRYYAFSWNPNNIGYNQNKLRVVLRPPSNGSVIYDDVNVFYGNQQQQVAASDQFSFNIDGGQSKVVRYAVDICPSVPTIVSPQGGNFDPTDTVNFIWQGYDSDYASAYHSYYKKEGEADWIEFNNCTWNSALSQMECSLDLSILDLESNQKVFFKVEETTCNNIATTDASESGGGGTVYPPIYITTRPWYQIESGDSYAGMKSSNSPYNAIYDKIPAQHYACSNNLSCIPYFNANNNGFISVNDSEDSLSLGDEANSPYDFCKNDDPSCLAISNNEYQDKNYNYAYWIRMVDNKTTSISDWDSILNPVEVFVVEPVLTNPISPEPTFSLPSIFNFFIKLFSPIRSFFSGNTISSVVREKQTDVLGISSENGGIFIYDETSIPASDFSGKQVMVIADGDIDITGDIVIDENSDGAFVLITSGNINISSNVTRLDGYYIADGIINTRTTGLDQQLTVSGGLISWDQTKGVDLQRNLDSQDNAEKPAELFVQRPDIIKALYDSDILRPAFNGSYTWQEVSP